MVEINKIAIAEGLEDLEKFREDSTVIESNIHHPTNNSLVWDCIKESHRLLSHLNKEVNEMDYRDYTKSAKKTFFKINNTRSGDKRTDLFKKQLIIFTKCINQVSNVVKKKCTYNPKAKLLMEKLKSLLAVMHQVYSMTERREIKGEVVANSEKIFSIYERHTDIIVKGSRDVKFGHKINLASGKSNLILNCEIFRGNPSDTELFSKTLDRVIDDYKTIPRDCVTDGGYTSKANAQYAQQKGIVNIVFNKIVGSLKNIVSSKNMETRLKKWRSGIEANISNLKRGFGIFCCNWKGYEHFKSKVMWSVIGYNIRVMSSLMLSRIISV